MSTIIEYEIDANKKEVAQFNKYGGNPPLKLERGLRNKGYLRY